MQQTKPIVCPHCEHPTIAEVKGSYSYVMEGPDEPVFYSLLKCGHCDNPMLTLQWGSIDFDGEISWSAPQFVYPKQERELSWSTPMSVEGSFKEAERCFRAASYTAAAIMCRRALEAVCVENGASSGTLAAKLQKMKDNDILDGALITWATMLRVAGNDAAHETATSVSKQDAGDMLDFTHAVIEHIYTYRQRYEAFAARRAKK